MRGLDDEDISQFISKVEFHLDASFAQPKVEIEKHPFSVQQVGWGQFTIGLTIYFPDPACKPVILEKELWLYEDDLPPSAKRPIVKEDYNELVFLDPSPNMLALLTEPRKVPQISDFG